VDKIEILVSGTAKTFDPNLTAFQTIPDFASQFDVDKYSLISKGNCKFLVLFNHKKQIYRKFVKEGGNKEHAILIRLEPDSVFPAQYKKRIEKKYGLVISPGSRKNFELSESLIGWPYKYNLNPAEPSIKDPDLSLALDPNDLDDLFSMDNWNQRSHKLVMIAGNKVSPISASNYGIRRKLAKTLTTELLAVYGPLWNESIFVKTRHRLAVLVASLRQGTFPNLRQIYASLFTSYETAKGPIPDKHKLLRDSKFNLVVENSNAIVTEKIFDALINGAIPIYIGPKLEESGLPSQIAIEVSGCISKIESIIQSLTDENVSTYLASMRNFVSSEYFSLNWRSDEVYGKIARIVQDYLDSIN
jgi:hypothetical protein